MKEFVCLVAVIVGAILVGFGNDLGLIGFIPATILMLIDDVKSNN
jgi:hypothetical protein